MQTSRTLVKWSSWIAPRTPPLDSGHSIWSAGVVPGGCLLRHRHVSPTYNSKMRSLDRPFEQVNTEQLVRRIYNWVTPFDSSTPPTTSVSFGPGQELTFARHPSITTHTQSRRCVERRQRDGGDGTQFVTTLSLGRHQITATVHDATAMVRSDPSHLLTATRTGTADVADRAHDHHTAAEPNDPVRTNGRPQRRRLERRPSELSMVCRTERIDGGPISGATSSTFTTPVLDGLARYWVRVTNVGGSVGSNTASVAVTFTDAHSTTDPTITTGLTVVKAAHILELRNRIDALRSVHSLPPYPWTTPLSAGVVIKGVHVNELRPPSRTST